MLAETVAADVASGTATPMQNPLMLYRSVSIPELVNVARVGAITGGQNRFNPFDARPLVFFGDALTDWLIGQGEATYRQAFHAAQFTDSYRECLTLRDSIDRLTRTILAHMKADRLLHDDEAAEAFPHSGFGRLKRQALRRPQTRRKYRRAFAALNQMLRMESKLSGAHAALVASLEVSIDRAKRTQPFTSAVLVTEPVSGGWRYVTLPHQGGQEYGFQAGQIASARIQEVIMIKDRRIVTTCSLSAACDLVRSYAIISRNSPSLAEQG